MITCPWCEREIDVPEIVEIDEHAIPPPCPTTIEEGLSPDIVTFRTYTIEQYHNTQQIMVKAGWRKVIR